VRLETLENDALRLDIAPDLGASPVAFEVRLKGAWHAVMRPTDQRTLERRRSAAFSSYTLAPYSNRIRDGRFTFQGRAYQLRPNWPGAQTIHGDVRDRPFGVARPDAHTITCHYDSRLVQDKNFPFDYSFTKTYSLNGAILETRLELTNASTEPMPAGFGIHPYFVRTLNGSSPNPLLRFHARGVYDTDDHLIPHAAARAIPPEFDFSSPKDAYSASLDHVFDGWDGRASLEWRGSGLRLEIEASQVFSHFVVFNGSPDGTIALEPVTHATDGFNLMDRGVPGTGVVILQPGETLQGSIQIRLEHTRIPENTVWNGALG
jgi:aldose 1-epimerase